MCQEAVSKSVKNFGRRYWACPNRCVKVFNGFVDGDNPSQTAAASTALQAKLCIACHKPCEVRTSQSEKNLNKKYFACPSLCAVWNGWVLAQTLEEKSLSRKENPQAFKACKSCENACFVTVTRFEDRPTEVFYKCHVCNLHNGAFSAKKAARGKSARTSFSSDQE